MKTFEEKKKNETRFHIFFQQFSSSCLVIVNKLISKYNTLTKKLLAKSLWDLKCEMRSCFFILYEGIQQHIDQVLTYYIVYDVSLLGRLSRSMEVGGLNLYPLYTSSSFFGRVSQKSIRRKSFWCALGGLALIDQDMEIVIKNFITTERCKKLSLSSNRITGEP
jgi:hypothetical protein